MLTNNRKSRRQQIRYTAWLLLDDNQLHGCVLSNASDHGACIDVEDSKLVPDKFMLLLSSSGKARRKCRVVWRKPQQLGVKFEQDLARREKVTAVIDADDNVRLEPA
jgi:hypothetical protein